MIQLDEEPCFSTGWFNLFGGIFCFDIWYQRFVGSLVCVRVIMMSYLKPQNPQISFLPFTIVRLRLKNVGEVLLQKTKTDPIQ